MEESVENTQWSPLKRYVNVLPDESDEINTELYEEHVQSVGILFHVNYAQKGSSIQENKKSY